MQDANREKEIPLIDVKEMASLFLIMEVMKTAVQYATTTVVSAPSVFAAGIISGFTENQLLQSANKIDAILDGIEKENPGLFEKLNKSIEMHTAKLNKASASLKQEGALEKSFLELPKLNSSVVKRMMVAELIRDGHSATVEQIDGIVAKIMATSGVAESFVLDQGKNLGLLLGYSFSPDVDTAASWLASTSISLAAGLLPYAAAAIYSTTNVSKALLKASVVPIEVTTIGVAGFVQGMYTVGQDKDTVTKTTYEAYSKMTWGELASSIASVVYSAASQLSDDLTVASQASMKKAGKTNAILESGGAAAMLEQKPHLAGKVYDVILQETALKDDRLKPVITWSDSMVATLTAYGAVATKYAYEGAKIAGEITGYAIKSAGEILDKGGRS